MRYKQSISSSRRSSLQIDLVNLINNYPCRLKSLMILYLATSKWARAGHVPSFEDYMEVGSSASGLHDFAAYGYISMDDCDQKQLNEWFNSTPKIFEALI